MQGVLLQPAHWPRPLARLVDDRFARIQRACREAGVPFHDDAGVDDHVQRVLMASDFAWRSFLRDPALLGPEFLQLMSDPRHADARAGVLAAAPDAATLHRELRRFRTRESLRLVWRDVNGADDVETTLAGASVLAEACIEAALRGAEREVAARHGVVRGAGGAVQRMAVFALGKLGGGELNFSSDVDLVLAHADGGTSDGARPLEAGAYFARVGQAMVALLAERSAEGHVHRVDLRLRPFGSAGHTTLSFAAMEQYFQREGRDWERYAWIKARPVAGDRSAGARFLETLRPFVFRRYLDYGAFAGLREMKSLIDAEVARKDLADHLKLGPGGIREIEFIVQLLQLIRGGREPALRVRGLLPALAACEQLGWLPSGRAQRLREAYRYLRRVENRLQMFDDEQTHEVPADAEVRERIALGLGRTTWADVAAELDRHRTHVSEEFAALMAVEARGRARRAQGSWQAFWRTLASDGSVDPDALSDAGFQPVERAVAELEALVGGSALRTMSARARERLDRVMPAILAVAAEQEEPLRCLARLLRLVQAVARRSVYLALLDEQPAALKRLATVFSRSEFLADRVIAHPLLIDDLLDDRVDSGTLQLDFDAELERKVGIVADADIEAEIDAIQEVRQSALFRIGLAVLAGRLDAVVAARQLAHVAAAVVRAVLRLAERELAASHGRLPGGDSGFAVIAYGSLGGRELGFGSDLDLVFLYDAERASRESDGARPIDGTRWYARLAQRVVHLLGVQTRSGRLYEVDVRLRPDGSKGLLVQSLAAFVAYQRERAWTWELQALVRSRPIAGDPGLMSRFTQARADLLAIPRDARKLRAEIGAMRERWRGERDRSDVQRFDLKQGIGGLVDIEFLLQALVLEHASRHPDLAESGNTADLIGACSRAGLLAPADAHALAQAHAAMLARAIGCTLDARPRVVQRGAELAREAERVASICDRAGLVPEDRAHPR